MTDNKKKILIPLPNKDFDPTEVSIPWKRFKENGFEVIFATEDGDMAAADPLLIKGVVFGKLGAEYHAIEAYKEIQQDKNFQKPVKYSSINPLLYDAIVLPGGHAKGIKQYLESGILQKKILEFNQLNKTIAGICHGVLLLSRTIDPKTGKSIIYNKKVTSLTKYLEKLAFYLTFWKLGRYYRTYHEYVQEEVSLSLKNKDNFLRGGNIHKPFIVESDNFITARWPKDANFFANKIIEKIKKS